MTSNDQIAALLTAAQSLAEQAKEDSGLAERLLADPAAVISETAGHPIPEGLQLTATRGAEGTIELSAAADPEFGELDDASLDAVAGGRDMRVELANRRAVEVPLVAVLERMGSVRRVVTQ